MNDSRSLAQLELIAALEALLEKARAGEKERLDYTVALRDAPPLTDTISTTGSELLPAVG
jgi:hypothetical protein